MAYPLIVVLLRKILHVALRHNIDGHVLFAGVLVLIVEIHTSMPQFYVLSVIEGWGAFFFSAFACVVTETLGADPESQFHIEGFTVSVFGDRRAASFSLSPSLSPGRSGERAAAADLFVLLAAGIYFFSFVIPPQAVYTDNTLI